MEIVTVTSLTAASKVRSGVKCAYNKSTCTKGSEDQAEEKYGSSFAVYF